jgi:hypothetical protein
MKTERQLIKVWTVDSNLEIATVSGTIGKSGWLHVVESSNPRINPNLPQGFNITERPTWVDRYFESEAAAVEAVKGFIAREIPRLEANLKLYNDRLAGLS